MLKEGLRSAQENLATSRKNETCLTNSMHLRQEKLSMESFPALEIATGRAKNSYIVILF